MVCRPGMPRENIVRVVLTALGCCLLLLGCRTDPPKRTVIRGDSATETRAEILTLIPIGTPLSQAEATLAKNGLNKMQDPSKWPKPEPGTAPIPGGKIAEDAPYVTFWIDVPTDPLVTRTWYVQLYHKAGVVEDIKVAAGGLTGP